MTLPIDQQTWLDFVGGTMELGVNWLVQSSLLIAVGLMIGHLLRSRGSAVQSAVYRTTLVAALVCPLVTWGLALAGVTGWSFSMPAAYSLQLVAAGGSPAVAPIEPPPDTFDAPPAAAFIPPTGEPPVATDDAAESLVNTFDPNLVQPGEQPALDASSLPAVAATGEPPVATEAWQLQIQWFGIVAVVFGVLWFTVGLVLLNRLVLAWWRLAKLRRRACRADQFTLATCRQLAESMRISPPEVLHSPFLPSPCLAGLRNPAVLLPETEIHLPLRDVLIHELAHLARRDCHWNLVRRVTTSVFFFQPLLWKLSARIEATAEEVCDDYVVTLGGDRRDYAHRLVDLAELASAPIAAAGVGIVSLRSMLAQRVARILDSSRSLSTRVGHALLALVLLGGLMATLLAGLVGVGPRTTVAESEASAEESEEAGVAAEDQDNDEHPVDNKVQDDDLITLRGRVIGPGGRVIQSADVCVLRWFWNYGESKPLAQVKSDDDGRFEISYRKSQYFETSGRPDQWREAAITAFAEGFGPGWVTYSELGAGEEATIRLVKDDVPIEGRIIDLEGNPVVGATIEMGYLSRSPKEDLTEWLEAVQASQSIATAAKFLGDSLPLFSAGRWPDVTTDNDGRFRIAGIGRERRLTVHVKGSTIATTTLSVVTRAMEPVSQPAFDFPDSHDETNYGARFEYAAAPSRPFEGIVRDAKTGEPIAGVEIWSTQFAGQKISGLHTIKTKTDENGRYRLEGMPKGDGNRVVVVPTDLPYFTSAVDVPNPPGIEPVELNIELHRGNWVSGKVTDKLTGKGVPARMYYMPFPDNKFAHDTPEFVERNHDAIQDRYRTSNDGTYRVVALPGRGVVAVGVVQDAYPGGQGYKQIEGLQDRQAFMKFGGALSPSPKFPTAVKEVQIDVSQEETVCDFTLESGRSLTLSPVDPEDVPLRGVSVSGSREVHDTQRQMSDANIEIIAMRDDETRTVLLRHEERRLGKALRVIADEGAGKPITVKLEPLATVTGQLVDAAGEPVRGVHLRIDVDGDEGYSKNLRSTATDKDGRFRHDAFLSGLAYNILAEGADIEFAVVARKLEVQPGETVDLGIIDITTDEPPEPVRTQAADYVVNSPALARTDGAKDDDPDAVVEYAGQVVTPDGQPAANANIFLVYHVVIPDAPLAPTWKPIGTTDAAGKFRISLVAKDLPGNEREWNAASLVATAEGFGLAWSSAAMHETSGEYLAKYRERLADAPPEFRTQLEKTLAQAGQSLRLVADEPITGRIVDINGQGVAGARLMLLEVWGGVQDDLTPWLEATKAERADYYSARTKTPRAINGPQVRSLVAPAVTNADGRFTLRGIGRERIAELLVTGAGIQSEKIFARTQAGEPIELLQEWRSPDLGKYTYYPAEFTYVAGPSRPIVGLVRDRQTERPLAGVLVKSQHRHGHAISGWGQDFVQTVTGPDGRYRLEGMPIGDENRIAAIAPSDQAYLPMSQPADTRASEKEVEVNFDLPPAVWVEGHVTDKQSGEGLPGWVHYYIHPDNPTLKEIGRPGNVDLRDRYQANDKGRFRIPVLPGDGVIGFMAFDHEKYPRGAGSMSIKGATRADGRELIKTEPIHLIANNYHIVAEISPAADAERIELKLELDSGGSLKGRVVDPEGKPVTGFYYCGQLAKFATWDMARGNQFDVVGYQPNQPRPIYVVHPERKLAGSYLLTGDPPQELTVTLQPAGKVTGRIIGDDGEPLGNLMLLAWQPGSIVSSPDMAMARAETSAPLPPNARNQSQWVTDADGRFNIEGLVPGIEYRLKVIDRESMSRTFPPARMPRVDGGLEPVIVVEPGQTLDLGDVRVMDEAKFKAAAEAVIKGVSSPAEKTDPAPEPETDVESEEVDKPAAKPQAAGNAITGNVVAHDGKPVPGAEVYWLSWSMRDARAAPKLVATTDEHGLFKFTAPAPPPVHDQANENLVNQLLVFKAAGHGLALVRPHQLKQGAKPTSWLGQIASGFGRSANSHQAVTLPVADVPLRGRLVNIDGQPIAGAKVRVREMSDSLEQYRARGQQASAGEQSVWQQRFMDMLQHFAPPQLPLVAPSATTDADGRFVLAGIGRDQMVELLIEGDRIESTLVLARTEAGEDITVTPDRNFLREPAVVHAAEFTHVIGPSKPLTGQVLDLDTGEPIAGAVVRTYKIHGHPLNTSRERQYLATVSDVQGNYRITGLPVGDENKLVAFAKGDEPYVPSGYSIDTTAAGQEIHQDFRLKRGVWAEGRVFDAKTKEPLTGKINYYIFRDADLEKAVPGLRDAFVDELYFTNANGEFRVPVLAARGILAFFYSSRKDVTAYPRGAGAELIEGADQEQGSMRMYPTLPHYLLSDNYWKLLEVHPTTDQHVVRADMPLSSGTTVEIRAVSTTGDAVPDIDVFAAKFGWAQNRPSQFEVVGLQPGENRKVFVWQPLLKLVGGTTVNAATKEPSVVTMLPSGSVRGRLVDEEGQPIADAIVEPDFGALRTNPKVAAWPYQPGRIENPDGVPVDKEGYFQIVGLAPGWQYSGRISSPRKMQGRMRDTIVGQAFEGVSVEPGEEKDLGDIVVKQEQ